MNVQRRASKFGSWPRCAVLIGLGLMTWVQLAEAQVTFSAASVSGSEGETVAVPIMVNLGSSNLAFFAVTFAVAQGSAPPVTDEITYESAPGVPPPDLETAVASEAKLAIGYAGVTIQPALVGRVQIGTLMVPIPFGAAGSSYQVQLARISAGDSAGKKLGVVGQPGTITISGQSGSAPGGNPPVGNQGAAPPPPAVEAPGTGPGSQAQAPGAAPPTARAPGANPFNAAALPPTLPEGAVVAPSPPAPEAGQGAATPGQAPVPQAPSGQAPAGQAPVGQAAPPGQAGVGQTPAPTGAAAEAAGTSTLTPTAAKTAAAPAATATKKVTPPAAPPVAKPEAKSGCQLGADPARQTTGWLLMAPIAVLLVWRRR